MPGLLSARLSADRPNQRQLGARFALLTLSAVNLLNFADRYVPSSVKSLLQEDLKLTDTQTSLPVTGMTLVYMVSALLFGWLADKDLVDRRVILSSAVAFWSLATALAGLAQNVVQLVLFRSLVGVGEAAYMSIAPPMISDLYPPYERNMALTVFNLAMPLGGALGYVAGAVLGGALGWRVAFLLCGVPGLLVALLVLCINDPARGVNDGPSGKNPGPEDKIMEKPGELGDEKQGAHQQWAVVRILSNPAYAIATAGMVANSFGIGGFADWYGELLHRRTDTTLGFAGLVLGGATAIGGIGGSLLGSLAAQHFEPRLMNAYFLVPALFMLPGAVLAFLAVNLVSFKYVAYTTLILGEVCIFTFSAPLTTISVSVIPPELRARSAGLQLFCIHILGDVISPPIIGLISDNTGSLQLAMQVAWVMVLVSGLFWWFGSYCLGPLPSFSAGAGGEREASLASVLCSTEEEHLEEHSEEDSSSE